MLASTLEEFARAPVGRYVSGDCFVHFCATPALWGMILWGHPGTGTARELGRSLIFELGAPARPHAAIVDASRLEGGDPAAYRAAERYLTRHGAALAAWVQRLALLRPQSGMGGAIVAGAYEVLPRPYPVAVFDDASSAFAWLGPEHGGHGPALLADLHTAASGMAEIVRSLQPLLEARLADVTIASAVRGLGVSERTLQRKLAEAGTTFKDQLALARVRVGKRRLLDSDAPLTAIAYDVGCASLQHFSAMFKRHTGESPSAFRRRHR